MIVNFQSPSEKYDRSFFTGLLSYLKQRLTFVVSTEEAAPRVILLSPDGKSWNVTVDNAGALVVAQNTGTIKER
jgi:hypothetical protein